MSRVAKRPVDLPTGVTATVAANTIKVKGAKGELTLVVADGVSVEQKEKTLVCAYASDASRMSARRARTSPTW
jgi:large subunit ribosomal protein L6